jgi:hypothetical protein
VPLLTSETFSLDNDDPISFESSNEKTYPANGLTINSMTYKIFGCQLEFNRILNDLIQLVVFKIPLKKVKYYEGCLVIIEFIKTYNN